MKKERDSKGRFVKGHKLSGGEKGWFTSKQMKGNTHGFQKGKPPWNKGKKCAEEIKQKIRENHSHCKYWLGKERPEISGQNHWNWNGGIQYDPYDKKFNNKFKRAIRKRDNYVCLKCGKHQEKEKRALTIHHIDYNKKLSIPQNCCAVCNKCNGEVNFNRKHWTGFFQSLLAEKYGYKYKSNEVILEIENYATGWVGG